MYIIERKLMGFTRFLLMLLSMLKPKISFELQTGINTATIYIIMLGELFLIGSEMV